MKSFKAKGRLRYRILVVVSKLKSFMNISKNCKCCFGVFMNYLSVKISQKK